MKKYFILFFSLVIVSYRVQACNDSESHVQLRECLEKKAQLSNKKLKDTENKIIKILNNSDEDKEYKLRTIFLFKNGQKSYIEYRESQCLFDKSLANGGNGARDMELACIIELNDTRKIKLSEMFQLELKQNQSE
jgi:uncharacterized protein YecT (DUF1311 family)